MADEIPKFPKATNLFINSGNIVNWSRLKQKPSQTPTQELSECASATLKLFIEESDATKLQYVTDLKCVHRKFNETVPKDERLDIKLTVKLFLCSFLDPSIVKEAIERALEELDTPFIEMALIAFPETESGDISPEDIKPYWDVLEKLVEDEKIIVIGVADVDKPILEELYESVTKLVEDEKIIVTGVADVDKPILEELYESVTVKPLVDQVNLQSCCVMPKDLVEYAKIKDIQLLTHNDPKDLISAETFQDVIRDTSTQKDGDGWEPQWVLRYSTLLKNRGIIKSKGYLISAIRDRKRK